MSDPLSDLTSFPSAPAPGRLRVAAIRFLNPAPLMWDFEHPPRNGTLQSVYDVHYTTPALCAEELQTGRAGLGLVPVASLTPELAVVRGCTIASLHEVRSILLLVCCDRDLRTVRTIATDTASQSSVAYAHILFEHFIGTAPEFFSAPPDPVRMLRSADAALLIGDPALLAREHRAAIEAEVGPCRWFDLAEQWHAHTGLPWVAAVWAARPEALAEAGVSPEALSQDLLRSRDAGLAHIEELVDEWSRRLPLPPSTIRTYLSHNIHYQLDRPCIEAILRFRAEAAALGVLPPLPELRWLT